MSLAMMMDGFNLNDLVRAMFAQGQQGAVYDPSDFSTLFQDAAGTTPVTALGQSDGLMLDKRLGLVLGAERLQDFTTGIGGTATAATYNTSTGVGSATRVDLANQSFVRLTGLTATSGYRMTITNTGAVNIIVRQLDYAGSAFATISVGTTTSLHFTGNANCVITAQGGTATFVLNSFRELPGNHATQSTAPSRPTVDARVNLLTKTEDFTDAAWVKALLGTGSAPIVTQNYAQAPDGSMTAVRVQLNQGAGTTLSDVSSLQQTIAYLPGVHTNRVYVKATSSGEIGKKVLHRGAASGAYTSTTLDGTWQEIMWAETASGGAINTSIVGLRGASGGNANAVDVLIWHPHVEVGTTASTYQRVNTATDYVDVGAPRYNAFDKTDDHLLVAAGGAGTTGILLAVGIMVPVAGTARTIWSDRGTNTGYRLSIDATNKVTFSGGTGAAFTTLTSAGALTAGQKYAVIAWHDGTNLNLSINNVPETPVACGTVTAGTATFTIGKDNGAASGYWGNRIYSMVYRKNDASTASLRSSLFSYIVGKMGGL